jgi:hypothetical protein
MDSQLTWFFGTCVTGFLFLTGWIINLQTKVSVVEDMKKKVDEVHFCLIGNMDKEGLISKVSRIDRECKLRHKES